jgi:hypothetical protein
MTSIIRLPNSVKPGAYYLKALNGHGEAPNFTSADTGFLRISPFVCHGYLSIAGLAAGGVKRRSGASLWAPLHRKTA